MNWTDFQTHNDAPTKAFEVLCNQLFENWCKEEYQTHLVSFSVVNGSGGDGGVESYAVLSDESVVGLQAKWFPTSITSNQFSQIKSSINTAMKIRPQISRYIVCIPRDLASTTARGENTEDKRWNEIIEALKKVFPSLTIDLWNETRIVTELQKESSSGIYKYWFEKSEIAEENIRFSFEKSKASWLVTKYVPELNTFGDIDGYISAFLGQEDQRNTAKKTFEDICILCDSFSLAADELTAVCGAKDPQLVELLSSTKTSLAAMSNEANKAIVWLNSETVFCVSLDETFFDIDIDSILAELKESRAEFHHHFHFYEVSKVLRKLGSIDTQTAIEVVSLGNDKSSLLFLGEPGTGKTHGIASETEKLLENNFHVPILIQARDIPVEQTWKDIIASCLGLSASWGEDEIWQALSSLANRKRFNVLDPSGYVKVLPKIIVMIDGIDESSSHQKWIDRIQETNVIVQKYPQIRFCFMSRPYAFDPYAEYARIINLGTSGDVPVHKLFSSYTRVFNINVINESLLKYALTTPLALKLFCDLHKGKTIEYHDQIDVSLTTLLQEKINILEKEFCEKISSGLLSNQYILRTIQMLAISFNVERCLEQNSLLDLLTKELLLNRERAETLLQYLTDYGILRLFCEHNIGYLSPRTYFYYPGIQGYFDHASALVLLDEYKTPANIDFEKCKYLHKNTLYALAIISIQRFDYLITDNATLNKIVDSWFEEELCFLALRHSNPNQANEYKPLLLQRMSESRETVISITNNIILPLARNSSHPLGCALLDEFLSGFKYPAQRDIIWSVPSFLRGSYADKWYSSRELALNDENYTLSEDDMATGCPLVYAWALSSVNNSLRKFYRGELMQWARVAPDEFYKLFIKFSDVNDPQVRADIFSILMCLLLEDGNQCLIEDASKWLLENVLAVKRLEENRDIAIRYYSCAIVQKAIALGVLNAEATEPFLPPYNISNNFIPLDYEALAGTYMGGYSGIGYDLARYVLIDHFTSCFSDYDRRVRNQFGKLISEISNEQPQYSGISTNQFLISAAFAFVSQCGWNESDFQRYDRDNKKAIGADCAISGSHHKATHGAQSQVMTICEKYVWQARNEIGGYLADRLLYCDDFDVFRVSDYGLLDDFIIPIQELNQIDPDNIPEDQPWHIPEKDVVILSGDCSTKENVINLVLESPDIDWKKWLFISNSDYKYKIKSNDLMALGGFSCFYSPSGVETCLFISSIIISEEQRGMFLNELSNDTQLAKSVANPTDWMGGIHTSCYITPKEVCWFPWKQRYNSRFVEEFPGVNIQSAVDRCCYNYQEYGDVYYDLPSSPIREMLGISNSDGYLFYNDKKHIKAEYCIAGDKWRTYQDYLLVDKEELFSILKERGNTLLWVVREYRREGGKSGEKFGEFYAEKDNCHIAFYCDDMWETQPILLSKDSTTR
ncbi:hypothetical protein [uncultured Phascolarctobacterium sp.]|uniref:hypothetical protein n=1 Tax=uncultured Phascolarctobacterium sp. TaxID=512296 RepID=UPI0025F7F0C6|nr:hypothetical protein [uncultured Phascolarctobacterium sp.]